MNDHDGLSPSGNLGCNLTHNVVDPYHVALPSATQWAHQQTNPIWECQTHTFSCLRGDCTVDVVTYSVTLELMSIFNYLWVRRATSPCWPFSYWVSSSLQAGWSETQTWLHNALHFYTCLSVKFQRALERLMNSLSHHPCEGKWYCIITFSSPFFLHLQVYKAEVKQCQSSGLFYSPFTDGKIEA